VAGKDECALYPQAKELMFHVLFHPDFPNLALSTLRTYFMGMKALAKACESCGFQHMGLFFSDDRAAVRILDELERAKSAGSFVHIGGALFNSFARCPKDLVGFEVYRGVAYNRLRKALQDLNRKSYQHPVIPWQIYKFIIASVVTRTDECLVELDDPAWVDIMKFHVTSDRGKWSAAGMPSSVYVRTNYPEFASRIGTFERLCGTLGAMQELSRIGILLFTGCRVNEQTSLTPDCLREAKAGTYLLYGRTTKTKKGSVYWVTDESGAKAVRLSLKIRRILMRGAGIERDDETVPLQPRTVGFPSNIRIPRSDHFSYNKANANAVTPVNGVLDRLGISVPRVEPADYEFLTELSKVSNLNLDRFKIGNIFPITAHQFRRSLAYYAMRSGSVEIGALKRQFKHLNVAMTEHYTSGVVGRADGSNTTMSDLVAKERLAEIDYRMSRHIENFEQLRGGVGTAMRRNVEAASERSSGKVLVIRESRELMMRRVKQGEINYTETPLGACTSTDPCLARGRGEVSACLSCKDAVLEDEKVASVHHTIQKAMHPFFVAQRDHFRSYLLGKVDTADTNRGCAKETIA